MPELTELVQLRARLDRLEHETRRLKGLAGAAMLVALAIGVIGAHAATVARSNAQVASDGLRVYDAAGHLRLFAGLNEHGEPSIHFIDGHGVARETIYLDPTFEQPTIKFIGPRGDERADYFLGDRDSTPRVELTGADGRDRFFLSASDRPYLAFGDNAVAQRMYLGLSSAGEGLLRMMTHTGSEVLSIEGFAQTPFIRIHSAGVAQRIYLGLYQNNAAGIELFDSDGGERWSMTAP